LPKRHDEAPAQEAPGISGKAGSLPFDTSVANQARFYGYLLVNRLVRGRP
jgi:hypothetical protein